MNAESDGTAQVTSAGRLPDFMVIGSMKAGSTTLYKHLDDHPGLFMCRPKEPQFFSRDEVYENGIDWYRWLFADASDDVLCGEASVCYTRYPTYEHVAERVHEHVPGVKLILIARDPVPRAFSHYRHNMLRRRSKGGNHLDFEQAVEDDPSILSSGHYVEQIDRFLKYYPKDLLHLLLFEDLISNRSAVLSALAGFLGVDDKPFIESEPIVANRWDRTSGRGVFRRQVRRLRYSRLGGVFKLIPRSIRHGLYNSLQRSASLQTVLGYRYRRYNERLREVEKEVRPQLEEHYKPHNAAFRAMLGRDRLGWYDDADHSA